jgi:succinate dehydrogenase / fumarate reductase flavoprotein subunit
LEIREGRGINGKDYVYLDVTPTTVNRYLAEAGETRRVDGPYIESKLPDILDFCRTFLGVDPVKEPMPVQPTAHYAMGGIPTNVNAEVLGDAAGLVIPGLYAAGEVACVSVHGANRLGTNSLTDLVVFGRRAGMAMRDFCKQADWVPLPANPEKEVTAQIEAIRKAKGKVKPYQLRQTMQKIMMDEVGVFRTAQGMNKALNTLRELQGQFKNDLAIDDRGMRFNTDLLEAWELGCLLDLAEITTVCALAREESRGGHCREDFPERDDANYLVHTTATPEQGQIKTDFSKKVDLSLNYQPAVRTY